MSSMANTQFTAAGKRVVALICAMAMAMAGIVAMIGLQASPARGEPVAPPEPVSATGSLTGVVVGADGPIDEDSLIEVKAFTSDGDFGSGYVRNIGAKAGTFSIEGPAGVSVTRVTFQDDNMYYLGHEATLAQPLSIKAGEDTNLEKTTLQPAGWLIGEVHGPDGAAINDDARISIAAYDGDGSRVASGMVETFGEFDNHYVIRGIPSPTTISRLVFYVDSGPYRGITVDLEPQPEVVGGSHVTGPAVIFEPAGWLVGKVTGPDGADLDPNSSIRVNAYNDDDEDDEWVGRGHVETEGDQKGTFRIGGLPDDTKITRLQVSDSNGRYKEATVEVALTVSAGEGVAVEKTIELAKAGGLSGKVTGPDGAELDPNSDIEIYAYN
ncbi:MAG: hypothetical protein Q8P61_03835, partial [Candidatus Nanopelagicales bacterium]|nr:hypothetical protein [Candidatus Nanopelagicales bacterium]